MTKKEFTTLIAEKAGITQKDATKVFDTVLEALSELLAAHDKLQLPGFGTFETKERKARQGRNPHTGETIDIPAGTTPVFKASKALKDSVNK